MSVRPVACRMGLSGGTHVSDTRSVETKKAFMVRLPPEIVISGGNKERESDCKPGFVLLAEWSSFL